MMNHMNDPYDLQRFVRAQEHNYAQAVQELAAGHKSSHWMWYVFPQPAGLSLSPMGQYFAIRSLAEAQAYLDHRPLGDRLRECALLAARAKTTSAYQLMGPIDAAKLHSCMTLFSLLATDPFQLVLKKYYDGEQSIGTLRICHDQQFCRSPVGLAPE